MLQSSNADNEGKLNETVASVMRVFVDALLDVPEHRRLALYHKLLFTLDANRFLWLFLALVFESHVVHARSETGDPKRKGAPQADVPKRLEVALQLVNQFPLETIFKNCVDLVQYVRMLPLEKGDFTDGCFSSLSEVRSLFHFVCSLEEKPSRRPVIPPELEKYNVTTLFNVDLNTPKVLRHYKYTIVTFLSALLSSVPLVTQVSDEDLFHKKQRKDFECTQFLCHRFF